MNMKRIVISLGLLGVAALVLYGCYYHEVVRVSPPPPRVESYGAAPYPDAVWVPGRWQHRRGDWDWIPGHWARRPRPGAVWIPGHWERRGDGWAWRDGRWEYR